MKQKSQSGVAHLGAILLVVVIVAVVGGGGYYIWRKNHDQKAVDNGASVQKPAEQTFTDSINTYSFQYPGDWKVQNEQKGYDGPVPDTSKESQAVRLVAPHAPKGDIGGSVQLLTKADADQYIAQSKADKMHTVEELTIHGKPAVYDKLNFTGPSNAERYVDHTYYIYLTANRVLYITFRESYYHNYPAENWNASQDLSSFKSIAYSVKALERQ